MPGLRLHTRLQRCAFTLERHDVLNFVRVLLLPELIGLLAKELLKCFAREFRGAFIDLFLGATKGLVQLFYFFLLVFGIFAGKGKWKLRDPVRSLSALALSGPFFFNFPGSRAEVPLHAALFLLL